ncbi:MAG: Uma2 family endonuclease [Jaaginema sp. PMC 1079.18]|nr:Uma2 family endonuclease [Jaaginema sp. PMC 1080.18]MEC4851080.1 Uma2 family endonuclease [Jaaginema sp. PMC 1079.18]MEC4865329.1 Uma2 family endonuclease [Jaaginema sp. PMC 1078.18]
MTEKPPASLSDWLNAPPPATEWVNKRLISRPPKAAQNGEIQLNIARSWARYQDLSSQGGQVYLSPACKTTTQGRCPDVAYLTAEQVTQFGSFSALPQSFPLIAEIVCEGDRAEHLYDKAREYFQAGGLEVWLVFPASRWIVTLTPEKQTLFNSRNLIKTQQVLPGFCVAVTDLLT